MGDIVGRLTPEQVMACRMSVEMINRLAFELGIAKRGHQHLWNELAIQYGFTGKKIQCDYETGTITTQEIITNG
jgi:hypothetical protein